MKDGEEKRRPLLADRFLAREYAPHERIVLPSATAQLKAQLRRAERFVFDEEAAETVARVVRDIPTLLVRELQFARPPYDITWLEWPGHAYWKVLRDANPDAYDAMGEYGDYETADHTVGYLVDHGRVNVLVGGTMDNPNGPANLCLLQYQLNTECPVEDQEAMARSFGCSTDMLDAFLWGSTYGDIGPEERKLLRTYNSISHIPFNPAHPNYKKAHAPRALWDAARAAAGELRTLMAMFLMLNRPSITKYTHTLPNSRGWVKNKAVSYLSHRTVKISLSAQEVVRLISDVKGEGQTRRRGRVEGHYCHDETAREYARIAGCIHTFEPTRGPEFKWRAWPDCPLDEREHWVCSQCGGKRWWRDDFYRGDATKGFVLHDHYEVGP